MQLVLAILLVFAWTLATHAADAPRLFYTDITSGPDTGGETNGAHDGAFVEVYGNYLGSALSDITVTWNGESCLREHSLTSHNMGSDGWYQKLAVQFGSTCTNNTTGNIVVTTSAGVSNNLPFVNTTGSGTEGNIRCVKTTGNDTTGDGLYTGTCWATPAKAVVAQVAGDVVYIHDGVSVGATSTTTANSGAPGRPKTLIAYPGATVLIDGDATADNGLSLLGSSSYWVVAGLQLKGLNLALRVSGVAKNDIRIIGNDATCPNTTAPSSACVQVFETTTLKIFGNYIHDGGTSVAGTNCMFINGNMNCENGVGTNQWHMLYVSGLSNDVDIGWNVVAYQNAARCLQTHNDRNGGKNVYNMRIHSNKVHDCRMDGLNPSAIDPSRGTPNEIIIENNIVWRTNLGPSAQDTSAIRSNNFGAQNLAEGTVVIRNNSLYDCATFAVVGCFINNTGTPEARTSNGSLISIVVSSNTATATVAASATNFTISAVTGATFTASSGVSGLSGDYIVASVPTSTTFTFTTTGVADGTYSTGIILTGQYKTFPALLTNLSNNIIHTAGGGPYCEGGGTPDALLRVSGTTNLLFGQTPDTDTCPSTGDVLDDPDFISTTYHNFALLSTSPALGAGTDANCPTHDITGRARAGGDGCDIGAYEYAAPAVGGTASYSVTGITDPTAVGVARTVTVACLDSLGAIRTDCEDTVTFSSSDASATVPANCVFASEGSKSCGNFTFQTIGEQSATAAKVGDGSVVGTLPGITVTAGSAASFTVGGYPSPVAVNTPNTVTITAIDSFGNTVTSYSGTVTLDSDSCAYTAPAPFTLTNGAATVSFTFTAAGTCDLDATDGSINGTQTGVTVQSGAVLKFPARWPLV